MKAAPLAIVVLAACGSTESQGTERYVNQEQGYSLDQPAGWEHTIVRGAAQFRPEHDRARTHHTIVVRVADKPTSLGEDETVTLDRLVALTERVLASMPRTKLEAKAAIEVSGMHGARFSLSFTPRGQSTRFRRSHTLLVGAKHLFHVIYTSPAGEPVDDSALRTIVNTLTEGV